MWEEIAPGRRQRAGPDQSAVSVYKRTLRVRLARGPAGELGWAPGAKLRLLRGDGRFRLLPGDVGFTLFGHRGEKFLLTKCFPALPESAAVERCASRIVDHDGAQALEIDMPSWARGGAPAAEPAKPKPADVAAVLETAKAPAKPAPNGHAAPPKSAPPKSAPQPTPGTPAAPGTRLGKLLEELHDEAVDGEVDRGQLGLIEERQGYRDFAALCGALRMLMNQGLIAIVGSGADTVVRLV